MLLVVLNSTDLLEFILVLFSKFKLVQCLAKQAFLRNLKWLSRVVSESRLAHHDVIRCGSRLVRPVITTVTVLTI